MFDLSPLSLGDSPVVIDCGANEGQFLDCLYAHCKSPRVVSIEMLPDVAQRCQERHPRATVVHYALAATFGLPVQYHRLRFTAMSSLLETINEACAEHYGASECEEVETGSVETITIDRIAELMKTGDVDLIKVDLQGGDLPALQGAVETLSRTRNVIVEVQFVPLYEGQAMADDVDLFLQDRGFTSRVDLFNHVAKSGVTVAADRWYSR